MNVTSEALASLQRRIERRKLRFRQASRYMAELNTSYHSRGDAFEERVHQNFTRAREGLESAQQELRTLLSSAGTTLLDADNSTVDDTASNLIVAANDGLLAFLANNPHYLHNIHSRTFEELIARIFIDLGCSVELMRATHDGGKDIILRTDGPTGPSIAYVQCKRNAPNRPVGIEVVRQLYGVHMADNVNKSMIVTTSRFTTEALDFSNKLAFLISLKDYSDVVSWLKQSTRNASIRLA